jgi:hypothetical protein
VGVEGKRSSFGLAASRSLNDVDNARAPQHTLGPDNPLVQAEHFRGIRLLGLYGSRAVYEAPASRLTLDLLLGAVSFVRRTESCEFLGYAPDGTPLNLGDIGTGPEVNGFVEPSLRYERELGRQIRLHAGAGHQLVDARVERVRQLRRLHPVGRRGRLYELQRSAAADRLARVPSRRHRGYADRHFGAARFGSVRGGWLTATCRVREGRNGRLRTATSGSGIPQQ